MAEEEPRGETGAGDRVGGLQAERRALVRAGAVHYGDGVVYGVLRVRRRAEEECGRPCAAWIGVQESSGLREAVAFDGDREQFQL